MGESLNPLGSRNPLGNVLFEDKRHVTNRKSLKLPSINRILKSSILSRRPLTYHITTGSLFTFSAKTDLDTRPLTTKNHHGPAVPAPTPGRAMALRLSCLRTGEDAGLA